MNKKEMIAMLLAGGQGSRLGVLTSKVAKPAVAFGGKYRIIDFPLSNCINSGIDTVGVLTQYQPLRLNAHIGIGIPWDLDRNYGGVSVLAPREKITGSDWYSGTANAVYQNIDYMDSLDPEYVLILSGDHVYKMDYSDMLAVHRRNDADCTIAVIRVSMEEASRFGIMSLDDTGRICRFTEKPKAPDSDLASMGIYIFNWKKLRAYLTADAADPDSDNDFGKNIIPKMLGAGERMYPYFFEGYWRDVGTIDSFWDANMDMLSSRRIDLYDQKWPIRAHSPKTVPQYIGPAAELRHSIVTEGCEVCGRVENSVLSVSVTVEAGAEVEYSILMPGAKIRSGAKVSYAIIGENTEICSGAAVGTPPDGREGWGIAVCGPNLRIGPGRSIAAGAMIYTAEEAEA